MPIPLKDSPQKYHRWLLTILVLAAVTRIVYFLQFQNNPFYNFIYPQTDAFHFDVGAQKFCVRGLVGNVEGLSLFHGL